MALSASSPAFKPATPGTRSFAPAFAPPQQDNRVPSHDEAVSAAVSAARNQLGQRFERRKRPQSSTRTKMPQSAPMGPRKAPPSFSPSAPPILLGSQSTLLLGMDGLGELPDLDLGESSMKHGAPRSGTLFTRDRSHSREGRKRAGSETKPKVGENPFGVSAVDKGDAWSVHFESAGRSSKKESGMQRQVFTSTIDKIGSVDNWKAFAMKYGSGLPINASLMVFKSDVEPVWEDKANQGPCAGKWILPTTSPAASMAVLREAFRGIVNGKLAANGAVITHKFGQAMVMLWMRGDAEMLERSELMALLGSAAKGLEEESRVRFKLHNKSKASAPAVSVVDSDYDLSPVLDAQPKQSRKATAC